MTLGNPLAKPVSAVVPVSVASGSVAETVGQSNGSSRGLEATSDRAVEDLLTTNDEMDCGESGKVDSRTADPAVVSAMAISATNKTAKIHGKSAATPGRGGERAAGRERTGSDDDAEYCDKVSVR